jgi:hypothetical protein
MASQQAWRDAAAMRWILALLALGVVACAPTGPRWVGENIHVVDGYWVDTERPCLPIDCAVALEEALRALPAADRQLVIGAALGGFPSGYVDASGQTILMTTAGLSQPRIVILDLADGRRRVVPLVCTGPIFNSEGALVGQETCIPSDLSHLRVGRQPGIGP